jgi:hypothetical protein
LASWNRMLILCMPTWSFSMHLFMQPSSLDDSCLEPKSLTQLSKHDWMVLLNCCSGA